MLDQYARARRRRDRDLSDIADGFFCIPPEELRGVRDLASGIRKRLSVFQGDELRKTLRVAHDELMGLAQDLCPLTGPPRSPSTEGVLSRVDRGSSVLHRGARHGRNHVLGRGIENVEPRAIGGFAPSPADPKIGRDSRQQIVVHRTTPPLSSRANA